MATTDPETEERLKSALWYTIGQLTDNVLLDPEAGAGNGTNNATPQFIGALMELVWTHIQNTAKDLESFAKHAGRTHIGTEDVLLLSRRNEGLETLLQDFVTEIRKEQTGGAKLGGKGKGARR